MAFYNEYDKIQLKASDETPLMPRTTAKQVYFKDGSTLDTKFINNITKEYVDTQNNQLKQQITNGFITESNVIFNTCYNPNGTSGDAVGWCTTNKIYIEESSINWYCGRAGSINPIILLYNSDDELVDWYGSSNEDYKNVPTTNVAYIKATFPMEDNEHNYIYGNTSNSKIFIVDEGTSVTGLVDCASKKYINNNFIPSKYSINEQIVGTWIDGKPIYQISGITEIKNMTESWGGKLIDLGDINLDISLDLHMSVSLTNGNFVTLPYGGGTSCWYNKADNSIYFGTDEMEIFENCKAYWTHKYTKAD